jgi:hypothetical protein
MADNYRYQIPLNDPNFVNFLYQMMEEIADKKVKHLPYDRRVIAKVTTVGSGVASIKFLDSDDVVSNVPVRDGLSLTADDYVEVVFGNNSLVNYFIDRKR